MRGFLGGVPRSWLRTNPGRERSRPIDPRSKLNGRLLDRLPDLNDDRADAIIGGQAGALGSSGFVAYPLGGAMDAALVAVDAGSHQRTPLDVWRPGLGDRCDQRDDRRLAAVLAPDRAAGMLSFGRRVTHAATPGGFEIEPSSPSGRDCTQPLWQPACAGQRVQPVTSGDRFSTGRSRTTASEPVDGQVTTTGLLISR